MLALAALPVFAPVPFSAQGVSLRDPFSLEFPELGVPPVTAPEVAIPAGMVTHLRLRVREPFAEQIAYGKIYTFLNGEAARTITNIDGSPDGHVVDLRLDGKPGFRLKPGKNVVEISAIDRQGRHWYASYVLRSGLPQSTGGLIGKNALIAEGLVLEEFPASNGGTDRQPPEILLLKPAGPVFMSANAMTLTVNCKVRDDSQRDVQVTINGQPVLPSKAPAISRSRSMLDGAVGEAGFAYFERAVAITNKTSAIVIEAKDQAGNLTRLTIPIKMREALNSDRFNGRKFALVVGISRYRYNERGLKNLQYADADARAVRDYLQRPEGGNFAPADILYLENEHASLEAVRAGFNRFLRQAGPNDLVLIFIAGHGSPDPDAPQRLYFLLHDSRATDMARTALPMSELQDLLDNRVRAGRVIVFVDTCHSAGLSEGQLTTRRIALPSENNLINLYAAQLFKENGRAILTASDVSEEAAEGTTWGSGHGVFTWALLKGLEGEADADDDHFVTAGELFTYVRERVHLETGGTQTPRALVGINAHLTLAAVPEKRR